MECIDEIESAINIINIMVRKWKEEIKMTMFDNEIQFKNYIKYYLSSHKYTVRKYKNK
jgi:hypothetical protein